MSLEKEQNIVYGGDTGDLGPIDGGCGSLGGLILSDLKKGLNRPSFVSLQFNECFAKGDNFFLFFMKDQRHI